MKATKILAIGLALAGTGLLASCMMNDSTSVYEDEPETSGVPSKSFSGVSTQNKATFDSSHYPEDGSSYASRNTFLALQFDDVPTVSSDATVTVSDGKTSFTVKAADETYYTGIGSGNVSEINVKNNLISVNGNKVIILPKTDSSGYSLLEDSTTYTVSVTGISGKLDGKKVSSGDTLSWSFTTRAAPLITGNTINVKAFYSEKEASSYDFGTIQGAFDYIRKKNDSESWTINVAPGSYHERLYYNGNASITLNGTGSAQYGTDATVYFANYEYWNLNNAKARCAFLYEGKDLVLKNISIVNTASRADASGSSKTQAETLIINGSANVIAYNSSFSSYQDTLGLANNGKKAWFYKCYIEGDVDFIWGYSGAALFEECTLNCRADSNRKTKTAELFETRVGTVADTTVGKGFVLYNSKVTSDDGVSAYYCGRRASAKSGTNSDYYDQIAIINTSLAGSLSSSIWEYNSQKVPNFIAKDSSGNMNVGWKIYGGSGYDTSAVDENEYAGTITKALYDVEYNGRYAILNRVYDKESEGYDWASSKWDLSSYEKAFGATTDNSRNNDFTGGKTLATWDFTAMSSDVCYNGSSGYVSSDVSDVLLYADASSGKLAVTKGKPAQFNQGTILRVYVNEGNVITVNNYDANYYVAGSAASTTKTRHTVTAEEAETGYVEIKAKGNTYIYSVSLLGDSLKTTKITSWDFKEATSSDYDANKYFTSYESKDGASTLTIDGLKYHGTSYGAVTGKANATISLDVTGNCEIAIDVGYIGLSGDVTVSLSNGSSVTLTGKSGNYTGTDPVFNYTGEAATLTITFSSSNIYVGSITCTTR